jgi:hypothetical protein
MGEKRLLWSSSSVKRVFRKIEIEMKDEISFKVIRDRNGKGQIVDGIRFYTKQLFTYLVHHFGLSEEAKVRQVEISLTVDGAPLDNKIGHVTIVFKICDKAAICPITKVLIFNEEKEGPNLQSGKFCFPVAMILAKYNKETYNKYLREIFSSRDMDSRDCEKAGSVRENGVCCIIIDFLWPLLKDTLLSPTFFSSTPLSKVASLLRKSRAKKRSERTQRPTQSGGKSLLRPVFSYTFHD